MRLKDFMTTDVKTISSKETVESAYEKMRQHHIHHLIVMEGHTVAGVVSDTGVGNARIKSFYTNPTNTGPNNLLVEEIMEDDLVTVEPETTLREAANLMRGRTLSCLPVLENDRLVGVVTTTDLLELLGRGTERVVGEREKRPVSRENPGRKPASFNPGLNKT